jgi:hypothetical protein
MKLKLFSFWLGGWFTFWAVGISAALSIGKGVMDKQSADKARKAASENGYVNVDLQQEQKDAIAGNMGAQGSIESLLTRANTFQQGQANTLAEQAMPGYGALSKSLTSRAQTMADHPYDVPVEVTKNLERLAAERGIRGGTGGQFNDFSLLRDFGVNSLQYGQANIQGAQSITGLLSQIAPKVNPMSPLAFYVSPQQNAAAATNNNTNNQQIAQSAANAQTAAANQSSTDLWNNLAGIAGTGFAAYNKNQSPSTDYVTPNNYPIGSSSSINGVSPAGAH